MAVLVWSAPAPLTAQVGSSFQVSAQVVAGCLVVGGVSHYGNLNFGSHSALASGTVSTALTGTSVTLQCTPGVALSMSIGGGQNTSSGTRNLKRSTGSQLLAYQLFGDAGFSQNLGIDQSVAVTYSDPNAIKLPVYAQAQLSGTLPAGSYTDVVQVVLTW
ncbi:spore coat U domain-containing protein [Pseudomonas sp. BBP2017]|uniref:Csu type fimbrial protein n=1 Tax=Pseudomonas sp. BBP2017 TaxID=2109731 RepID=UPI000D11A060|nr:spore coat U domain-containing protein [Pseudomonas sp. BBP2017]PSS58364.1 spore coat protein [Pseudomonas sp. BBP2017]